MFTNKKRSFTIFALLALALTVSGCASAVKADQPPSTGSAPGGFSTLSPGNEIGGYVDLVDALKEKGAEVESLDPVEQPFFDVSGQIIKVNAADVQVFEFGAEHARQATSDQISPNGSSVGTTMITWMDQPNFWAKGRVVVLYLGMDAATIGLLSDVLGEPITTHE